MSNLGEGDPGRGAAGDGSWRDRYRAARGRGVPLDPTSETVPGIDAFPTDYAKDHLLITSTEDVSALMARLRLAAADFGWGVELRLLDGRPTEEEPAMDRARRGRAEFDLPTIYRVAIFPAPSPDRDDQPVPPIDAWRLLQRARARGRGERPPVQITGVSLDHVLTVDDAGGVINPFGGGKTNPFGGGKTNPFGGGKTYPFGGGKTYGVESYGEIGSGARQVAAFVGPGPVRTASVSARGRRPVVAVLDTGCGEHPWLPETIVTRYPKLDERVIGLDDKRTDPETFGDQAGAFDGWLDSSAGHGTFIAGVVRQVCPEADLVSIRVADSEGNVLEGDFLLALRSLVKSMLRSPRQGGRRIDVINLSIGFYHETPDTGLFDKTLAELLLRARREGCTIVCSAGNDATSRPTFPAALWRWPGRDFVAPDSTSVSPHLAVGALNPNGTVALFSNIGGWVSTFAPGASVLSSFPALNGGLQAEVRSDRDELRRETIDPDDFRTARSAGYALWSGTSFAAPYVAGMIARELAPSLMAGELTEVDDRIVASRRARTRVVAELKRARRSREED